MATQNQLIGTVNPVTYEIVEYNHEMEYHNGVIIVMQRGWYTCTANTRGSTVDEWITIYILVENRAKSGGRNFALGTATTTYSGYFDQFDLIQTQKAYGLSVGHIQDDWFECRMIP